MKPRSQISGFTLVEIMISIVIGLFLTAGIVQMFVANKQTYRFNEALARMQENGRLALTRMAGDLRMSGFFGCKHNVNLQSHIETANAPPHVAALHDFDGELPLEGRDSPGGAAGDPDEITMRGAVGPGFVVVSHAAAGNPVTVNASLNAVQAAIGDITNGVADIVLVSDCVNADVFQVTSLDNNGGDADVGFADAGAAGTPGNGGTPLSRAYGPNASLYPLRVVTYDLNGTSGNRTLRRVVNGVVARSPLVDGVENMQITYGEDLTGDGAANRYVPAASDTDWDAVVSVRVALLLNSVEQGLTSDAPQTFTVNDVADTCPKGQICQLMTATIQVRNRIADQ